MKPLSRTTQREERERKSRRGLSSERKEYYEKITNDLMLINMTSWMKWTNSLKDRNCQSSFKKK